MGAACYGLSAIASMTLNERAVPFALCIGFNASIEEDKLREAMKGLYSTIHTGGHPQDAVEAANFSLGKPMLEMTTGLKVAYEILQYAHRHAHNPESAEKLIRQVIADAEARGVVANEEIRRRMPEFLKERSRVRIQEAWDRWFPAGLQQRDAAYQIDWSAVAFATPTPQASGQRSRLLD